MREQRVGLEHRVDRALVGPRAGEVGVADHAPARRWAARARRPSAASSSCRSPTGRAGRRRSPAGSRRSMPSTAVKSPNVLVTPVEPEVAAAPRGIRPCQFPITFVDHRSANSVSSSRVEHPELLDVVVRDELGGREDQRVLGELGVDLLHLRLGALDGTDVVDPRGHLRRDRRGRSSSPSASRRSSCAVEVIGTIMLSDHSVPPDSGRVNVQLGSSVSRLSDEDVAATTRCRRPRRRW